MGNLICFCHWFLHSFLERIHFNSQWLIALHTFCWFLFSFLLFRLRFAFTLNKVNDVFFKYSIFLSTSLHLANIHIIRFCVHFHNGRSQDFISFLMLQITFYLFWFFLFIFWRILMSQIDRALLGIFWLDLHEQISNLANLRLLVVDLGDDSHLGRCYLGKLFIWLNISNFLELLNSISLGNV